MQRLVQVQVADPVVEVRPRDEDLRAGDAEPGELLLVEFHEAALPHRRARLLQFGRLGGVGELQGDAPQPHGAGGDDEHFPPLAAQAAGRFDDAEEPGERDAAVGMREDAGPHLEHDAPRARDRLARHCRRDGIAPGARDMLRLGHARGLEARTEGPPGSAIRSPDRSEGR